MRAIKVLVVVMGLLIIVGTVVLAFKITQRMGTKEVEVSQDLILPQGAKIREVQTCEGQILLRLTYPSENHEELWILNSKKVEIIRKIITN